MRALKSSSGRPPRLEKKKMMLSAERKRSLTISEFRSRDSSSMNKRRKDEKLNRPRDVKRLKLIVSKSVLLKKRDLKRIRLERRP